MEDCRPKIQKISQYTLKLPFKFTLKNKNSQFTYSAIYQDTKLFIKSLFLAKTTKNKNILISLCNFSSLCIQCCFKLRFTMLRSENVSINTSNLLKKSCFACQRRRNLNSSRNSEKERNLAN